MIILFFRCQFDDLIATDIRMAAVSLQFYALETIILIGFSNDVLFVFKRHTNAILIDTSRRDNARTICGVE